MAGHVSIIRGDALNLPLADSSVDLVVTSPPYFGLRSYQDGGEHYDGQIGAEATPAEFVDALIAATREMVRVVKPSGSIWVNLGDKYAQAAERSRNGEGARRDPGNVSSSYLGQTVTLGSRVNGVKQKSLIGIPWRYAIRCIDELGLILRAEVIWSKRNGLPESVTDRVRRSHEHWFHFVTEPRYYSAVDEVREPTTGYHRDKPMAERGDRGGGRARAILDTCNPLGKLPSSVWEINEEESLVRCVLSAIHAGALTIDEGERILKGQTWTGEHASGARSTSPATAGSGRQAARPRDTASSGSTAGQSSRTESPSNSATDPSPMDSSSTTSAASDTASATLSQSPSATTCSEDPTPSQPSTQPRPTAPTATSSTTPTPTARQTEAACAESACEQATAAPTGERSAPQPDAPGSVWTIATEPLHVPDHLGIDHFAAFPTEWPRRIITGWSPREVCSACGEGRRPVTDRDLSVPWHWEDRRVLSDAETKGWTSSFAAELRERGITRSAVDSACGTNGMSGHWTTTASQAAVPTPEQWHKIERAFGVFPADLTAVVHKTERVRIPDGQVNGRPVSRPGQTNSRSIHGVTANPSVTITGYACACPEPTAPTTPGVVLDPFGGTGTTALVSSVLDRDGISVDMSADYCRLAEWRTSDPRQRAKAARVEFDATTAPMPGQASLFGLEAS